MGLPSETVTSTLVAMGAFAQDDDSAVAWPRILDVEIERAPGVYEHLGGNPNTIVAIMKTAHGSGKLRLTTDEIVDETTFQGRTLANFRITQGYPQNPTKAWRYSAASGYVTVGDQKAKRSDEPTKTTIMFTPIAGTPGTIAWDIDSDHTYSAP